jgi:hypothetical protein
MIFWSGAPQIALGDALGDAAGDALSLSYQPQTSKVLSEAQTSIIIAIGLDIKKGFRRHISSFKWVFLLEKNLDTPGLPLHWWTLGVIGHVQICPSKHQPYLR